MNKLIKSFVLFITVFSITLSYSAVASDTNSKAICAKVSKILEPSEDCFYFEMTGHKKEPFCIYIEDKNLKKKIEIVESSFKKKTKIYVFYGSDGETTIESKCPENRVAE
jgi:hypothetical protein